jgi:hypothetical protein
MPSVKPLSKPATLQAQPAAAPANALNNPAVVPQRTVSNGNDPNAAPPSTSGNDLRPQAAPAMVVPQMPHFPQQGNLPGRDPQRIAKAAEALAKARAEAGALPHEDVPADPAAPVQPETAGQPSAAPAPVPLPAQSTTNAQAAPETPAAPPEAPPLPPNATPAQRNAWEIINEGERRLAEERKKLQAEREALTGATSASQVDIARLRRLEDALRGDPTQALAQYGWTDDMLAQALVARHRGEAPPAAPQPAQPAVAPTDPPDDRVQRLEGALVGLHYQMAANGPEYDIVRNEPGGINRAIQKAMEFQASTGMPLTPQQALSMVQDELVTEYKALIAKRDGDPNWQAVLGSNGSPAPTAGGQPGPAAQQPVAPAANPEPLLTSITNDVAASGVAPAPMTPVQYEEKRLERARNAIARNRG